MISVRIFTVLATVVTLVLGLVTNCYPDPAGVNLPEITFSADRDTIVEGECTTLHWEVTGLREGDTVHVDREQVKPSGQKKVCPTKSRRYELELRTDVGWFGGDFLDIEVVPPEPTPEPECTQDKQCCDLHEGEVWKCDEDGNCVKVGCNEDVDCKICPGEWKCEPPFGDCVKATPTPEPQCTDDAGCDPDADEECVDGECRPREPEEPAPPPPLTKTTLIVSVPEDMGVGVHVFDHTMYAFSGKFDGSGCGQPFSEAVPKVCGKYAEVASGEVGADRAVRLTAPLGPTFLWYATRLDQDGNVIAFLIGQVDTTGTTDEETVVPPLGWLRCGVGF